MMDMKYDAVDIFKTVMGIDDKYLVLDHSDEQIITEISRKLEEIYTKGNGYGTMRIDGRYIPAHRASYMLFIGDIEDGLDVCHICDNRSCVNPDHLFAGTRKENMADAKEKGRTDGGKRKRISEQKKQDILAYIHRGYASEKVSRITGVCPQTVNEIKRNNIYKIKAEI